MFGTNSLGTLQDVCGNRYLITREIGGGGQGSIYLVQDDMTGAPAIAKLWHPYTVTADAPARLDALIALRLSTRSPSLCGPIARLDLNGGLGAITPFVEGETLEDYLEHAPYSVVDALGIAATLAKGLVVLDEIGLIHGDIAAGNIMIVKRGSIYFAVLIDLDNSRIPGAPAPEFMGQDIYAAPELLAGRAKPSRATDAFAFGVILHMILLRRHPFAPLFESGQISTQYKQHIASHAVWLEDPALGHPPPQSAQVPISILPRQMHDLFRRALQMNAATRPQAKEWAAALTEALDSVYRCSCGREFVNEPTRYRCYGCGAAAAPYELHIGGKKLSLATMSTVLGRDALGGDLHVSREHAVFERRGFGLRVTNLSANGLAVKDTSGWSVMRQGERRELSDGDRVRFAVGVEGIVCAAR